MIKESQLSDQERHNSIGFLRIFFAGLVVYAHSTVIGGFKGDLLWEWSWATLGAGTLGVQSFFVISGALVATSWLRNRSLVRFLWHRILRLAPAFWVCLLVTAFVFTPLLHFHTSEPRTPFFDIEPSAWDYVWHNLLSPRAQIQIGIYPNGGPWAGDWNGSLWTLFYESACYLFVAALGLLGLLRRFRELGAILIIGFVALFSFWAATQAAHPTWFPSVINRLFDTPGKALTVLFLGGTAWALFPEYTTPLVRSRWIGPLACVLLIVSCRMAYHHIFGPWLLPIALFWLARVLPFTALERQVGGDYSYGLYVYHYPVQQILAHFHVNDLGFAPYLVASFVAAILCAIVSWHLVEKRALSLKNLFPRPVSLPTST